MLIHDLEEKPLLLQTFKIQLEDPSTMAMASGYKRKLAIFGVFLPYSTAHGPRLYNLLDTIEFLSPHKGLETRLFAKDTNWFIVALGHSISPKQVFVLEFMIAPSTLFRKASFFTPIYCRDRISRVSKGGLL